MPSSPKPTSRSTRLLSCGPGAGAACHAVVSARAPVAPTFPCWIVSTVSVLEAHALIAGASCSRGPMLLLTNSSSEREDRACRHFLSAELAFGSFKESSVCVRDKLRREVAVSSPFSSTKAAFDRGDGCVTWFSSREPRALSVERNAASIWGGNRCSNSGAPLTITCDSIFKRYARRCCLFLLECCCLLAKVLSGFSYQDTSYQGVV